MINQERKQRIKEVLTQKQPTLQVMLNNVSNSQNISAIIRSCDGVGVLDFYYSTVDNLDLRIHKTITQGTHRWLNRERVEFVDRVEFLQQKKKEGFQVLVTHLSEESISFSKVDYTKPTVLVMGNEHDGISDEVLAVADVNIVIPMRGMAQSLNVSVATALILYEAGRQRDEVKMYDEPQLTEEMREKIMEDWIYRDLIRHRSKGRIFY